MREEDSKWFPRWEEELPSPEELMPISQTLITPHLALAFDIPNPISPQLASSSLPQSSEFESPDLVSGATDEPARTLKRPRLVWTPQLHKRFVDAVAHIGIKNAVPKTIMQLMSVDGLTRENVASHLQKYRLYLKRMQGFSGGGSGSLSAADAATDHLFASAPVPAHFLHPGRPGSDHFLPFVPVAAALQHHHHQQMVVAAAQQQQQQQQYHHRQVGHFGSPPGGQFEQGFMMRQSQPGNRMVSSQSPAYVEDLESGFRILVVVVVDNLGESIRALDLHSSNLSVSSFCSSLWVTDIDCDVTPGGSSLSRLGNGSSNNLMSLGLSGFTRDCFIVTVVSELGWVFLNGSLCCWKGFTIGGDGDDGQQFYLYLSRRIAVTGAGKVLFLEILKLN
ncbi:hypothetical protein HHK36_017124 [Tetracentron sinense]|uniref:HTH myb-type domain-containing protein n=1 Tax=Tetracentron sinense TaxID=13715 RepID=A0A834Z4M3_TETSI|nr:hypothetical protein HHK36_017124 [Tetracentron sinense]